MRFWFLSVIVGSLLLGACSQTPNQAQLHGKTMGTYYRISIVSDDAIDSTVLLTRINDRLDELNVLLSNYIDDSEISRLNRAQADDWFTISPDTYAVFKVTHEISALSQGALDPTLAPLINLWHFGPDKRPIHVPSDAAILHALKNIGQDQYVLGEASLSIRKNRRDLSFNLSAVAKGYAVDQLALLLNEAGYTDFLVDIGGELRASGKNVEGKVWQVAIEKPLAEEVGVIEQVVGLNNISIATSGSYRNYFQDQGVRYSHVIDPMTGRPIDHHLVSVSVLHQQNSYADGFATAILVLGEDQGYEFALQNDLPVYMIVATEAGFVTKTTPQMQSYLEN